MNEKIKDLLDRYSHSSTGNLLPILQDIQQETGYLSEEAIVMVGKHLSMPTSKIYGLATFYNQFRFQPKGKFHFQLCHGTSCHLMGAVSMIEFLEKTLKVKAGYTTRNGNYSLEIVPCMGACSLSPVIAINGKFHGNLTFDALKELINEIQDKL
ncbi:MAG: NAD(P)H-dependent oxidoreductase subunit E [Bacteroidales bacterium]